MRTATVLFDRTVDVSNANQWICRLDPPFTQPDEDNKDEIEVIEFVCVSAIVNEYGIETYIFACDESGKVLSYRELPGSYHGDTNHEEALRRMGYAVILPLADLETQKLLSGK